MKTKAQIEAVFNAAVRGFCIVADVEEEDAGGDKKELSPEARMIRSLAAVLAWVLDQRDYPDFADKDRFINRVLSIDDQFLAACEDEEKGGG